MSFMLVIWKTLKKMVQFVENIPAAKACLNLSLCDPRCRELPLKSFLFEPVERLGVYTHFIKRLIDTGIPKDGLDCKQLKDTSKLIERVINDLHTGFINIQSGDSLTLVEIASYIEGCELLDDPSRVLVRDGPVQVLFRAKKTDKFEEMHMFLFNDKVVLAKNKQGRPFKRVLKRITRSPKDLLASRDIVTPALSTHNSLECTAHFSLCDTKLINIGDSAYIQHCFELVHWSKAYVCQVSSNSEKVAWVHDIKVLLKTFQIQEILQLKKNPQETTQQTMGPRQISKILGDIHRSQSF